MASRLLLAGVFGLTLQLEPNPAVRASQIRAVLGRPATAFYSDIHVVRGPSFCALSGHATSNLVKGQRADRKK